MILRNLVLRSISGACRRQQFEVFALPTNYSSCNWTSACVGLVPSNSFHSTTQNEAARKGTRARKAKNKVKKEEKIRPYLLKLEQARHEMQTDEKPFDKSHYPKAIDDVYFYRKYQLTEWDFKEAIQNHREVHHPTVYNLPKAPVILRIDMDFRYPNRPQKCMDAWKSQVEMKAPFLLPGMEIPTVLAIVPDNENILSETLAAGGDLAGGLDIIKSIQQGEIRPNDYEFIVCHPLLLPEMTPIRGLMKRNFPNLKSGTIDEDVPAAVKRLKAGLKIQVIHNNENQPDYAYINTHIGTLDMDIDGLVANFESILKDTLGRRVAGKSANDFIIQCLIKTPHTFEEFKMNIQDAILRLDKKKTSTKVVVEEEKEKDEDENEDKVEARA